MTLAAIEFNDQSLLIQSEDEARHHEPGYARLTDDGVVTGEAARAVAWREPQHMYNQFWCHLNLAPLANPHRHARHHGDMAFAQLRSLWQHTGSPDSLLLLTPGSFTHAQLSLLLGLVNALPAATTAVVDSALAACLDIEEDTLFVDLHMHEAVLTVCSIEGGTLRIVDQEVFPGAGVNQIYNSVARHISDHLIESYRFDPLHSSETEQTIYDQLPSWLTQLCWEPDVSIKLESDKGELPCILRKEAVEQLVGERLAGIRPFVAEWSGCQKALSHQSAMLAGLMSEFADARVTRRSASTRRALANQAELTKPDGELRRIREIEREGRQAGTAAVNGAPLATHLMWGEQALPLDKPLSIRVTENGPWMRNELDKEAALTVVLRHRSLETLHGAADEALPSQCLPGESIVVGGHKLKLIRVQNV
ncbi:MAG: hypothetical protein R3212_04075 [Xanthomonadales bacterium]|nr:hypothetical protein [Xanthomonadales bacterium]